MYEAFYNDSKSINLVLNEPASSKNNTDKFLIKLLTDACFKARPSVLMENQQYNIMLEH